MKKYELNGTINELSAFLQVNVSVRLNALGMFLRFEPNYIFLGGELEYLKIHLKPDDKSPWIEDWLYIDRDPNSGSIILTKKDVSKNPNVSKAWEIIHRRLRIEGLIGKSKRGPNEATKWKIRNLVKHRKRWIDERGQVPGKTASCNSAEIDPKTVKSHAPELYQHWEDKNYRFENWEF